MLRKKRFLSVLLSVLLVLGSIPVTAMAETTESEETGLCEHHPQHTAECGYMEAQEEIPCNMGCADTDGDGTVDHAKGCTYQPAVEGHPCTYVCEICNPKDSGEEEAAGMEEEPANPGRAINSAVTDVQKLIDALPTAAELERLSQDEQGTVYDQVQDAYDAYNALTTDQQEQITGAEVFDDLFDVFNSMTNALASVGDFNIDGGAQGTDYSYSAGVLTILTDTPLIISNTNSSTATSDRIVIGSDVNANLTLNGVNITAPAQTSAIDVPSGASLTLTLANNSTNTLAVSAAKRSPANNAGIHVPEGASLTIQCATASGDNHQCSDACGHITVTGGEPNGNGFSGAGIGGNGAGPKVSTGGEDSGTVRINGGNITITGGTSAYPGPGIGGGSGSSGGGDCGEVYIAGGIVNIYGSSSNAGNMPTRGAAGIGGGNSIQSGGNGGVVVITSGTITVIGGDGTSNGYGGAGIGGGSSGSSNGGDGGTVIILTGITVTGGKGDSSGGGTTGNTIGGGFGSSGSNNGDEGDGIRPSTGGNNTYEVYGDLELPGDIEIPSGVTLTIPSGSSLTVPSDTELVVDGTLEVESGGSLSNSGTISGDGTLTGSGTVTNNGGTITVSNNDFAASVALSITSGGSTVSSVTYGSTVTLTANVTGGSGVVNDGTVNFYQGTDTTGTPLNSNAATVTGGTATYELALTGTNWKPGTYTITAVYTPANGSGLLSGSGTATLPVSKATPSATPFGPISSSSRSETGITLNTVFDGNTGTYGPIQYGYTMGSETTPGHWQDSTAFTNLNPGTDYTFYTRYAGNDYYNPSGPSSSGLTVTTQPDITTTSLPTGYVGVPYNETLAASAANDKVVTRALAGDSTLPAGLTLQSDGTITGTPKGTATNHSFYVQATIQGGAPGTENLHDFATLSITINVGTPVITANTYNGEAQTDTFAYGDTITVRGTISASATAPGTSTNAITQNQVGLYLGETELATADVDSNGNFTLSYDTAGQGISIGEDQTLTVRYGGSSALTNGETTVTVTLNKRPVTVTFTGSTTKVYDGNTNPPKGLAIAPSDGIVVADDDVTVTADSIAYNSANVSEANTITASGIALSGSDADWYTLSGTEATTSGSITAADIDGTVAISGTPVCGQALTATYEGNAASVTWQWYRDGEVISGATGETYTLTVEDVGAVITVSAIAGDKNHTGSVTSEPTTAIGPTYTVTIPEKVDLGGTVTISASDVNVASGQQLEVAITGTSGDNDAFTLTNQEGAEITYTVTAGNDLVRLNSTVLTVNGGKANANGETSLTFVKPDEEEIPFSGTYTGTMTFTIRTREVSGS